MEEDQSKEEIGFSISSTPEETQSREKMAERRPAELPFHVLLLSDLAPQGEGDTKPHETPRIHNIDKYNFSQLLQELSPHLFIEVPNYISNTPETLDVKLSFSDLKDFRPERIILQVPELTEIYHIRTLIDNLSTGKVKFDEFQEEMKTSGIEGDFGQRISQLLSTPQESVEPPPQQTPTESSPSQEPLPQEKKKIHSKDDALDSLLGMVDSGGEDSDTSVSSESSTSDSAAKIMDSLVQAVTASADNTIEPINKSVAEMIRTELTQLLADQINAILHHSQFQDLEASWRGLKFLVDRIDFRKNIFLSVLPVHKNNLNDMLHHHILQPTYDGSIQTLMNAPISVIAADFSFNNSGEDITHLTQLAETLADLQVPLMTGLSSEFFGKKSAMELNDIPSFPQLLKEAEYLGWNTLRNNAASNYLTLVLPRFLLRYPYGKENKVKDFHFTELKETQEINELGEQYLWENSVFALAVNMARSFAETGWSTHISGIHTGGKIENLPLWDYTIGSTKSRIPLEVMIRGNTRAMELYDAGLTLMSCQPNDDAAYIAFAPTVYRPPKYDDPDITKAVRVHATLACQLFATHVSHYLSIFQQELVPGLTPEHVKAELAQRMQSFLKIGGNQISSESVIIESSDIEERPDYYKITVHLVLPANILGQEISLGMELELHK